MNNSKHTIEMQVFEVIIYMLMLNTDKKIGKTLPIIILGK